MKTKSLLLGLVISLGLASATKTYAQQEIKTFYDLAKTKIKEKYSINASNQKNGLYIQFDDRGIKALEMTYVNGVPNGTAKEYYLPGYGFPGDEKLKTSLPYVSGKREGLSVTYTYQKNGKFDLKGQQIKSNEKHFKNDEIVRDITYYENGKIATDLDYSTGINKEYYANGNLATLKTKKSNPDYGSTFYDGPWQEYFENGKIQLDGIKKDAKWFGKLQEYYSNGKTAKIENYALGDMEGEILEGECTYYDSLGQLTTRVTYDKLNSDGSQTLLVENYYPKEGKIYMSGKYIKSRKQNTGVEIGVITEYFKSGSIKEQITYKEKLNNISKKYTSKPDGIVKTFTEDGLQIVGGQYTNEIKTGDWTYCVNAAEEVASSKDDFKMKLVVTYDNSGNTTKVLKYTPDGKQLK
ncbi:MAG: hypothetical protein IT239_07465 [Bacteroidia bacterium]|nr:hypothetical protein [Bacteroidia bacterium]